MERYPSLMALSAWDVVTVSNIKRGRLESPAHSNQIALMLHYNGLKIPREKLLGYLCSLESELGDLSQIKMPSRLFKLPLTFESKRQAEAITRYMETQRPYASYLPDNIDFVAKNNAFTREELEKIFLTANFMVIAVGFFTALPLSLPVDPRQRMCCPKANPSRVFTPGGSVSWGGSCMAYDSHHRPGQEVHSLTNALVYTTSILPAGTK